MKQGLCRGGAYWLALGLTCSNFSCISRDHCLDRTTVGWVIQHQSTIKEKRHTDLPKADLMEEFSQWKSLSPK